MPGRTILVAEDSEEDAFILKRAFAKAGINVPLVFVSDGEEAIDYLSDEKHGCPRLLLLDLKMPKRNGFDVLSWLQKQKGLHRLIVTVLSSSGEVKDVNRAYDLGANSFIVKPSSLDDYAGLVEAIKTYWLKFNSPPSCLA